MKIQIINKSKHLLPQYAFDFDGKYWYGDYFQKDLVNLTFCLPHYYIKLKGFELVSVIGTARPKSFALSVSIENHTYTNYQNFSEDFPFSDDLSFASLSFPILI